MLSNHPPPHPPPLQPDPADPPAKRLRLSQPAASPGPGPGPGPHHQNTTSEMTTGAPPATATATATESSPLPLPRVLARARGHQPPELITQGAEGLLYRTTYLTPSVPCALKWRPPKPYRHPVLDARLTRQRILAEARILAKCRREAVPVPAVYCVDEAAGWLMMEWVDGCPVRVGVNAWLGDKTAEEVNRAADGEEGRGNAELVSLMRRVGAAVGRLHAAGLVHGDLTTSNMMLRPAAAADGAQGGVLDGEIIIIDFGLASQSTSEEDRAVDLYVLERAFLSTHPRAEKLFGEVLNGYRDAFKGARPTLKKLEEVRMRGRKRSMLG